MFRSTSRLLFVSSVSRLPMVLVILAILVASQLLLLPLSFAAQAAPGATPDSRSVALGRRLFEETRFAEFFARARPDDVNRALDKGDPRLERLETIEGWVAHPFRGRSVSCAACHFALETESVRGVRIFNDFARRSPIPDRGDGLTHTLRNSPTILGTVRDGVFLHWDGEFATAEDLSLGGLLGRNFGWLKSERTRAIAQIARVIREDRAPAWTNASAPYVNQFLQLGLDVTKSDDEAVARAVAARISDYMRTLDFSRDSRGLYDGSPYDAFLIANDLPRAPAANEKAVTYMQRLAKLASSLASPRWVTAASGRFFKDHEQEFRFGPMEMKGLVAFSTHAQCVHCHAAPDFTDHLFHNIGVSQEEYESIHGFESFHSVSIPGLEQRSDSDLEAFARIPAPGRRDSADLGLWTMLMNPRLGPAHGQKLLETFARTFEATPSSRSKDAWLELSVAAFKTPTLRNLGLSAPFFHTGHIDTIEQAVMFYVRASNLARRETIRSADPELKEISIRSREDILALSAFLRSLNEDVRRR